MEGTPLVSICIPTYNRAQYLEKSLKSIVKEKSYLDGCVEIVISDNCSDDSTQELCMKYSENYDNIVYRRNSSNIGYKNVAKAMQIGTGIFRKPSNDTLIYNTGGIDHIVEMVKRYMGRKPVIFFSNGAYNFRGNKESDYFEVNVSGEYGLDNLLNVISFGITWLGAKGFWEEECGESLSESYNDEYEGEVIHFLKMCNKNDTVIVSNNKIVEVQSVSNKDLTYGIFRNFYEKFFPNFDFYLSEGRVSKAAIKVLKKDMGIYFFPPWMAKETSKKGNIRFGDSSLRKKVFNEYKNKPYFVRILIRYYYSLAREFFDF